MLVFKYLTCLKYLKVEENLLIGCTKNIEVILKLICLTLFLMQTHAFQHMNKKITRFLLYQAT